MHFLHSILSYIVWHPNPEIFSIGPVSIRWYGLLFMLGFVIGQHILGKIFKLEGKPDKDLDSITIYMVLATIVGARLGHVFFYEPEAYLKDPIEILFIWKGGLASHGATIGILIGLYLYKRSRPDQSYLWIVDRIVIVVALGAACIRLGNLMNSEIIGKATNVPWAFIFTEVDSIPRHPAQLYEAISCFILFFFLLWLYYRKKQNMPEGLLWGIFMVVLFGLRFFYEFLKENQVPFEDKLALNMGQILSIPAVLVGFFLLWIAYKNSLKIKAKS